jgi:hypothetical protein
MPSGAQRLAYRDGSGPANASWRPDDRIVPGAESWPGFVAGSLSLLPRGPGPSKGVPEHVAICSAKVRTIGSLFATRLVRGSH